MKLYNLAHKLPAAATTCLTSAVFYNYSRAEQWTLCSAHVFFRHGSRTPLYLLPGIMQNTAKWDRNHCKLLPNHNVPLHLVDFDGKYKGPFPEYGPDSPRSFPLPGNGCWSGALTTVGQRDSKKLGKRLRQRYGQLWDEKSPNPDDIFLRSTPVNRNFYSLRSLLSGFFMSNEIENLKELPVVVMDKIHETLYPNRFRMDYISENLANGAMFSSRHPEHAQTRQALQRELQKYDPELSQDYFDPTSDKYLRLFKMRDDLVSRIRHGLCTSPEMSLLVDTLHKVSTIEMLDEYLGPEGKRREHSLKLILGTIVHEILKHMLDATQHVPQQKLFLYATHDSFLMPLMLAMGILQPDWPPFASDLCLELWREVAKQPNWHVKIMYCGKELLWCPLKDFVTLLQRYELSYNEFEALCPRKLSAKHTTVSIPGVQ